MDYYAKYRKEVLDLRHEMIEAIKTVLSEKGYSVGDKINGFVWEYDRLLIEREDGPYHPDNLSTDFILDSVRKAMHVIPKALYDRH